MIHHKKNPPKEKRGRPPKPPEERASDRLYLRIPQQLKTKLKELAEEQGLSLSEIVFQALKEKIKSHEKFT